MQHEILQDLKRIASELGHAPTYSEYFKPGIGRHSERQIRKYFGNFSGAIIAAGLQGAIAKPKKIDNSIFHKDIEKHLEEYKPRTYSPPLYGPTLAIISDIHWPFHCQRVIDAFYRYVEENKPDYVIINGDAWDMYSHSKYPRSHNIFTPREEERLSREGNEKFWKEIKSRSPGSKCVQMMGNHDVRPMKKVLEAYPEAEDWVKERLTKMFSFEGVKTIMDPREELRVDEETFIFHGNRVQLGAHRDYTLMSCHIGHTHKGGTVFKQLRGKVIYEANSGVAGDPESKGLSYTAQRIHDMTPGFGARDRYGPRFIPA